ncbi:MAG: GNAT family N-acetyltransferase [Gammaproteobacteria bacterium]|nr:GNAT family N-acetyltransferase [Gammaproteobacteria bacterium]
MTVDIRPAEETDVDALARFWHENMNSRVPLERWRSVASPPWYTQPPSHGWIAVDGGRIVGAMALVHSTRAIDGRLQKLCNIGSLYVLREYRGRGIARAIARGLQQRREHHLFPE